MSTVRKFKVNDRVTPDPAALGVPASTIGNVYVVKKTPGGSRKNYQCDAEGGGRGINFPAEMLLPADAAPSGAAAVLGRPFEPTAWYEVGEVVTFKRPPSGYTDKSPFVVFKDSGEKVNVTPLGGAEGRYWRVPKRGDLLVKRDLAWLAERLVDEVA